jgi:hypothetical protein
VRLDSTPVCHLGVCVQVPGETWPEVFHALQRELPELRGSLASRGEVGLTLRLPALAAFELYEPDHLASLQSLVDSLRFYVFSLDGFRFGSRGLPTDKRWGPHFPDWRDLRRLSYTNVLADLLADLLPDDVAYGSITTVALGGRASIDPSEVSAIARNLLRFAAYLVFLRQRTGKTITLALELTPACLLETVADARKFFRDYLYSPIAVAQFAATTGLAFDEAQDALRRHLGVGLDLCHQASMFETPSACIEILQRAGIPIVKMQIATALCTRDVELARHLLAVQEELAACPAVELHGNVRQSYEDARAAFARPVDAELSTEWRIACHAPASEAQAGRFGTTQAFTREFLQLQRALLLTAHLEVETGIAGQSAAPSRGRRYARELEWANTELGLRAQDTAEGHTAKFRKHKPDLGTAS